MKNKKLFIVCAIGILLIILGFCLNFYSANTNSISTEVFMFKNKYEKYALFNEEGKQLSDFLYEEEFFEYKNLVVLFSKDGGAIYNKAGKKLYSGKEISSYKVIDNFYFKRSEIDSYLYDYRGEKLKSYNPKEMKLIAFLDSYILIQNKQELNLLTEAEEFINVFKNEKIAEDIKVVETDKLVAINNNGINYIIDKEKQKTLSKLVNPDLPIYLEKRDDNYIYGFLTNDEIVYHYYKNDKKLYELKDKKCSLNDRSNKLICYSEEENQSGIILSEKGKSYALQNQNSTVSIFYNSKFLKAVNGILENKSNYYGIYTIVNEEAGRKTYSFYKLNGEELLVDQNYSYAESFNSLGHLVVAKDTKYFLLDKNGKKISDEYLNLIEFEREGHVYYIANENTDEDRIILNDQAKEIYKTKSKELEAKIIGDKLLILASETNSKKLDVITAKLGLVIKEKTVNLKNNHIEVSKKDNYDYYTFEGKLITSIKK